MSKTVGVYPSYSDYVTSLDEIAAILYGMGQARGEYNLKAAGLEARKMSALLNAHKDYEKILGYISVNGGDLQGTVLFSLSKKGVLGSWNRTKVLFRYRQCGYRNTSGQTPHFAAILIIYAGGGFANVDCRLRGEASKPRSQKGQLEGV